MTSLLLIAALQGIDPRLLYLAIAGLTWLLVYLWRRYLPTSWDALTKHSPALQSLPALVLSGLLAAMPAIGKDLLSVITEIIMGMVMGGGGAIVGHHVAKALPMIPYRGAVGPKAPDPSPGAVPSSEMPTPNDRPPRS